MFSFRVNTREILNAGSYQTGNQPKAHAALEGNSSKADSNCEK